MITTIPMRSCVLYIQTNEENRVIGHYEVRTDPHAGYEEIPDNFSECWAQYRLEDNELIFDEGYMPKEIDTLSGDGITNTLRLLAQKAELTDREMLSISEVYPKWDVGIAYAVRTKVRYHGTLYEVVQVHTSQADWTPDTLPALYKEIRYTQDSTLMWVQPQGAHDAYNKGDKVSHNNKIWQSEINANVYPPEVYGWVEVKT